MRPGFRPAATPSLYQLNRKATIFNPFPPRTIQTGRTRPLAFWHYGLMAVRKMTFGLPETLALQFLCRVPSRDRSRFVSEALAAQLEQRDLELIRACEIANLDLNVAEIEKEFDGIGDTMAEPWK